MVRLELNMLTKTVLQQSLSRLIKTESDFKIFQEWYANHLSDCLSLQMGERKTAACASKLIGYNSYDHFLATTSDEVLSASEQLDQTLDDCYFLKVSLDSALEELADLDLLNIAEILKEQNLAISGIKEFTKRSYLNVNYFSKLEYIDFTPVRFSNSTTIFLGFLSADVSLAGYAKKYLSCRLHEVTNPFKLIKEVIDNMGMPIYLDPNEDEDLDANSYLFTSEDVIFHHIDDIGSLCTLNITSMNGRDIQEGDIKMAFNQVNALWEDTQDRGEYDADNLKGEISGWDKFELEGKSSITLKYQSNFRGKMEIKA